MVQSNDIFVESGDLLETQRDLWYNPVKSDLDNGPNHLFHALLSQKIGNYASIPSKSRVLLLGFATNITIPEFDEESGRCVNIEYKTPYLFFEGSNFIFLPVGKETFAELFKRVAKFNETIEHSKINR